MKITSIRNLLLILGLSLTIGWSGCKSGTLETGGAYAPTNTLGQVVIAPDIAFFQVDAAFDLAYSAFDAAFKFEKDNRPLLWQISPDIKHSLDVIRPDAVGVVQAYAVARKAYLASPTPAGLDTLRTWLSKAQQLANMAQAVVSSNLVKH